MQTKIVKGSLEFRNIAKIFQPVQYDFIGILEKFHDTKIADSQKVQQYLWCHRTVTPPLYFPSPPYPFTPTFPAILFPSSPCKVAYR